MNRPSPANCRDCRFSAQAPLDKFGLLCHNQAVNGRDPAALSGSQFRPGTLCLDERRKVFFGACGRSGKMWEAKTETAPIMTPA
jgi:hypothetical protein